MEGKFTLELTLEEMLRDGVGDALNDLFAALNGTPNYGDDDDEAEVEDPDDVAAAYRDTLPETAVERATRIAQEREAASRERRTEWDAFANGLGANGRQYLTFLEDVGEATPAEIATILGISPQGVGAVIGAITKKAKRAKIRVPFRWVGTKEKSLWKWVG